MMNRIDILRKLLEYRKDGIQKEERIVLVEQDIETSENVYDDDELKEIEFPECR